MPTIINKLRLSNPECIFTDVDVKNNSDLVRQYGIVTVPTVVVNKNNQEFARVVGLKKLATYEEILKSAQLL